MKELLLELFSEEIPAMMQGKAAEGYREIFTRHFKENNITFENLRVFIGPRRVTLLATGLPEIMPAVKVEVKGPRVDAPMQAIEGFCRSSGITRDQLSKITVKEHEFFAYIRKEPENKTEELLLEILPKAIAEYVWPKSMYWGSYDITWVRPLKNILCLFGGQVLPIKYGHLKANNVTCGHRFAASRSLRAEDFADYTGKLDKAFVVLDQARRKNIIIEQLGEHTARKGLRLLDDQGLLEEVTGLVEYPNVMMGTIPEKFMRLPKEVLITSMRTHQRYFSLIDAEGNLAPYFLFVSNSVTDNPAVIIAGNEKVLAARLSDALYFYDQDRKVILESGLEKLESVIFHAKLGNLKDKVDRLVRICEYLAPENKALHKAARLCKSDLVSEMVVEFPELQGIMGYHYAMKEGLGEEVALAIRNHYKPQGQSDQVPSGEAAYLALADKIDSLVGLMLAGEMPTGSKDPYALRRQALGVIRIILAERLEVNIKELVSFVVSLYSVKGDERVIISFLEERAKFYFKEHYDLELVNAVLDLNHESDLFKSNMKLATLKEFLATASGESLISSYKRANNILRDSKFSGEVEPSLFTTDYEKVLYSLAVSSGSKITSALIDKDFNKALQILSELAAPIGAFFDNVMIKDEDPKVAGNRLLILDNIRRLFCQIAKFDHL